MGHGIGLAPNSDGSGTTPDDMQRWLWSLYRTEAAALVRGCEVSGTSGMTYRVTPGVIVVPTGEAQAIAVPIDAVDVATLPAPSSGTRTDYIWATDTGAVQVGESRPAGTALLGKRRVPANITATTATLDLLGNRLYAPLYGASMGRVASWHEGLADLAVIPDERSRVMAMTFTVDNDRRMQLNFQQSYDCGRAANAGSNPLGWKRPSMVWETWIDGVHRLSVEVGVEDYAETKQFNWEYDFLAGTHTIEMYRRRRLIGLPDDFVIHRKGGASKWPGTSVRLMDIGGIA